MQRDLRARASATSSSDGAHLVAFVETFAAARYREETLNSRVRKFGLRVALA